MTVNGKAEAPNPKEVVLHYSPSDGTAVFSMAESLKSIFRFYTPKGDRSDIWFFDARKGIWKPLGKELIAEIVSRSMSEFYKSRILNEVIRKIRDDTRNEGVILGRMSPSRIVMANGVFDMDSCTFSPAFTPDDYQIIALDYDYDVNADCPRFKQFLEEVCPNPDDQQALVEFMGYCLVHNHKFHTFLVLVGNGENGKSKFLGVLKEVLGPKNVTGISLQHLAHNTFAPARLVDKLANICPDIPDAPVKYTGAIKAMTGEDLMTVEHKHQDSFEMENHAKLLFSANQIPSVKDTTDAWFRRVRIIEFPNQFKVGNVKRDPNLGEKLSTEIQGIFNHVGKGWQRLKEQGHLTGAKSTEENRVDYLRRSNPLQYFAYQYCSSDPDAGITVEAAHDCYRRLSIKLGKVPVTKSWFGQRLIDLLDYMEPKKPRIGGKQTKAYAGLRVDIELLRKELGDAMSSISIYQGEVYEFNTMIVKNATHAVTDGQERLMPSPNGDSPRPQVSIEPTVVQLVPQVTTTAVKAFHKWLSKLPNAGSRGFKETEVEKAHGDSKAFTKYIEKGWLEQRGKNKSLWWKSELGQSVLAGGGTK
jgi:putative DNA primase/helicase